MSVFTNFLNLFKWDPLIDGEEDFDINKALNDNWDKIDATVGNKVDKITGKGLSTNDYTNTEKSKLSNIEDNATARKVAMIGSDASSYSGWYKVASQITSGYGNTNITFLVTSTYASTQNFGILEVQMRSDNTSVSCKNLKWLVKSGFSNSDFIINISGMTWTLYVNFNTAQYGRYAFEILSTSSIQSKTLLWPLTFADNTTKETVTPNATITSSYVAAESALACTGNSATADQLTKYQAYRGNVTNTWIILAAISIPYNTALYLEKHALLFIKGNHNSNYTKNGIIAIDALTSGNLNVSSYNASIINASASFDPNDFYIEYLNGNSSTGINSVVNFWIKASAAYAEWDVRVLTNNGWTIASNTTPSTTTLPSTGYTGKNSVLYNKALQDSAGQQINNTYIKGFSVAGRTITYTKGDNTTGSITTQDTTYAVATATTDGLMPAADKAKLDAIGVITGWESLSGTLTYSSADSPTFVVTTSVDLTGIISKGMKIKLTQNLTVAYFFVTAITSTTITLYGGIDYTLTNATISNVYFSMQKAPYGFSMDPDKWTITVTLTSAGQNSPVANTYYNSGKSITIPIGLWNFSFAFLGIGWIDSASIWRAYYALSTSTTSFSDSELTTFIQNQGAGSGTFANNLIASRNKNINLTSKTTYYLLYMCPTASAYVGIDVGSLVGGKLKAVCAYL